jgi:hypothetical protein
MLLLQRLQNHMSKGNKGNRPERKLAAISEAGCSGMSFDTLKL